MKVIIDLMEAYSDHIGLPIFLVNSNGEVDYKIAEKDCYFSLDESMIHLSELKNISLNLTIPTVVSVSDESYKSSLYYIVMPAFSVSDSEYFLAAGSFIAESIGEINMNNQDKHLPIVIHEEEVEVLIGKMQKLYRLLIKKSKDESNLSIPKQIVRVLQTIGNLDCDIDDYDQFLENILEELLQIESLDFLGVAEKNKDDIYVIKHIYGDEVQNLAENRFFIGEGLLGKAVILGNDFYWSKDNEPQRAEFFNRYGIFPTQLFGFPLKQEKIVDGILFGGSFQKIRINENLMGLLKCVVRIVSQKKNVNVKLMESHYIQAIFANWLD